MKCHFVTGSIQIHVPHESGRHPRGGNPNALDGTAVERAAENAHQLDPCLVDCVRRDATVPVDYYRSVGRSINVFAVERAMDELAVDRRCRPGARTPAEIALSILAEVVAVRNGVLLRQKKEGSSLPHDTRRGAILA